MKDDEPTADSAPTADEKSEAGATSVQQFRRFATAVCVVGMLVQLLLTAYYLGMGHRAAPHDLPAGLVAGPDQRESITTMLEEGGAFEVGDYASADVLTTAIKRREVYGGVDVTGDEPVLGGHLTVLVLYAAIGCLIVLITNILPNRTDRTSEVDLGL